MAGKKKLRELLVARKFFEDEAAAARWVMAGKVIVNGQREDKPGLLIDPGAEIRIRGLDLPYVSRGGLKLAGALHDFEIDVWDKVVIDVGASTGGFTDCVLKKGARLVYAVDVGYGQLSGKLRADPRVVNLEKTNVSCIDPSYLSEFPDLATIDVSYLSLRKAIPAVVGLLKERGEIVALVKPLFEARTNEVQLSPAVYAGVLTSLIEYVKQLGLAVVGVTGSPILGSSGTAEFFMYVSKDPVKRNCLEIEGKIMAAVEAAERLQREGLGHD